MNPADSRATPINAVAPTQFVQHSAGPDNVLLARGAASDVWLLRRSEDEARPPLPEDESGPVARKYISKCVRLSPQSILQYHGGSVVEHKRRTIWRKFVQEYTNRIERWRSVEDKNVVEIYEFSESEGLNRQEEYCEFGTADLRPWPEGLTAQSIIINAVRGLRHLHRLEPPIIHGNLSADKVYISSNNQVKLGGFGIAVLVQSFAMVTPTISLSGSCRWMSPELFEGENENMLSLASDIWALGCTIYEIISGNLPYSESVHDVEVARRIKDGEQPGAAEHILDQELTYLWPIIEDCWASAPEKRPPANIVLSKILNRRRAQGRQPQ